MILELETLSKLPPHVRQDVESYCRMTGQPYKAILSADRACIWEMGKVHGLMTYLAALGHPLKYIHTAANTDMHYAGRVLKYWREKQTPIRTTDYERFA